MKSSNPDFHWPFDKKDHYGLFISYCFWILNILQVAGIALIISFMQDFGIAIPEAANQLAAINIGIGGGIILSRVLFAVGIYLKNEYRKEEVK